MRYFRLSAVVGLVCAVAFAQGRELRGNRAVDEVIKQVHEILKEKKLTSDEARELATSLYQLDHQLGRTLEKDKSSRQSDTSKTVETKKPKRRELRQRRRRQRKKKSKTASLIKRKDLKYLEEGSGCRAIYDAWLNRDDTIPFSKCIENPLTTMMINQNGETCLGKDRTVCKTTDGCMWVANMYAGSVAGKESQKEQCVPDPCFRINNGQCTIQHTGGRCVWYTEEMNAQRGFKTAGCYQSPCNNPLRNSPGGCAASGNEFYKCSWCGSQLGCQNAERTSKAQCWNIGSTDGCNKCKNTALSETPNCKSDQCKSACCQSPYCECIAARAVDAALDIGNSVPDMR